MTIQFDMSAKLAQRGSKVFPGAINSLNYLLPAVGGPLYIDRADGAYLYDVDGNRFIDFWPSHSALLVGHNHPAVREAVERQIARGSNFGLATQVQVELAERLQERFPSIEKLVFTDSNTRATSYAVKLARAATNRQMIAKIQGGYHGTVDTLWYGLQKLYGDGPGDRPVGTMRGVSERVAEELVLLQWNRIEETLEVLRGVGDRLAGIIVEPVLGDGIIPPAEGYLQALREHCTEVGALLVYDEAVTCGMSPGGAQQVLGVLPDITVVGKSMGGGMPIAAVGASAEVMSLCDPSSGLPPVPISMTYAGHPVAAAAGLAQLDLLGAEQYAYMTSLADRLAAGTQELAARYDAPLTITTANHLFYFHWGPERITDWRDHYACSDDILAHIQNMLLEDGIYLGSKGRACMSTAHTEGDIARLLESLERALKNQLAR
ncbi:MAG TPA: aminotransferase class III-fold pyridoxal phosphate-dependent enzyme [Amycolatopsis sp.]|nr:aminotransferase class III-fold pyridoxal phosphate-dependent enzyme [Amycolatopsis sp.]